MKTGMYEVARGDSKVGCTVTVALEGRSLQKCCTYARATSSTPMRESTIESKCYLLIAYSYPLVLVSTWPERQ